MRATRITSGILLAGLAACPSACALHSRPIAPEQQPSAAQRNFEAVWQASLDVLRQYNFPILRRDRRAGVITTGQITGKQFFEFWRDDAGTAFHVLENTLQTIYRRATVTVWAKEGSPEVYQAGVTIELARSNLDSFQVSSTSEAYTVFALPGGRGSFVMTSEQPQEPQAAQADRESAAKPPPGQVLLGRDTDLEARIAKKIAETAARYLARGR